jgi:hypothetical protein
MKETRNAWRPAGNLGCPHTIQYPKHGWMGFSVISNKNRGRAHVISPASGCREVECHKLFYFLLFILSFHILYFIFSY